MRICVVKEKTRGRSYATISMFVHNGKNSEGSLKKVEETMEMKMDFIIFSS